MSSAGVGWRGGEKMQTTVIEEQLNKTFKKPRDIEVKNNLTTARGEGEGTVERGVFRNYYKGHMDNTKGEGRSGGRRWVWLEWSGGVGRK